MALKRLSRYLSNKNILLLFVLVSLISYGQTLLMYFWHDDYTVLYYLLNGNTLLWFPYQSMSIILKILLSFFYLNATFYLLINFILFIFSCLLLYQLLQLMFKNGRVALIGSLVYASGYIGQQALMMPLALGLGSVLGMNLFLATLIFIFNNTGRATFLSFFFLLELSFYRFAGGLFVVLLFSLVLKRSLRWYLIFIMVFIIQAYIKPSYLIIKALNIPILPPVGYSGLLTLVFKHPQNIIKMLNTQNFINLVANFGNIIYPSETPGLIGFSVLVLLILVLIFLVRNHFKYYLFSLLLPFCLLSLYFFTNPERVFNSYEYYLFPLAVAPSFILGSLLMIKGKSRILFLLVGALLILTRAYLSFTSQKSFVETKSIIARDFYSRLTTDAIGIKSKGKHFVHIEASDKNLTDAVADSMRVGALPSEAAVAVHFQMSKDNLVLIDNPEMFINNSNEPVGSYGHIHTYLYDGLRLKDTSDVTRKLIFEPQKAILISPKAYKTVPDNALVSATDSLLEANTVYFLQENKTLGVYPIIELISDNSPPSQMPLIVEFDLKSRLEEQLPFPYFHLDNNPGQVYQPEVWDKVLNWKIRECKTKVSGIYFECVADENSYKLIRQNTKGTIEFDWSYNTFGRPGVNKYDSIEIPLDGQIHNYRLTIPAGGEFLTGLRIKYISFPGTIEISTLHIKFAK